MTEIWSFKDGYEADTDDTLQRKNRSVFFYLINKTHFSN